MLPHDHYKSQQWTLHLALRTGVASTGAFSEAVPTGHVYLGDQQVRLLNRLLCASLHGLHTKRCTWRCSLAWLPLAPSQRPFPLATSTWATSRCAST